MENFEDRKLELCSIELKLLKHYELKMLKDGNDLDLEECLNKSKATYKALGSDSVFLFGGCFEGHLGLGGISL